MQILRINRGLHTLEQTPFLREIIRLEDALGDAGAESDREQDLLAQLRRHPDDLRTVPVLRELAHGRMAALKAFLAHKRPAEKILGCLYEEWPGTDGGGCRAGSRKTVVQGLLAAAQRFSAAAIGMLLQHER